MSKRNRVLWANLLAAIDGAEAEAKESRDGLQQRAWEQFAAWLRELRARRIAMGREPDDERNAAADIADDWPAGTLRSRNAIVIAFARETWPSSEGAEGETVHLLCDELERLMGNPRPDEAKAALDGGHELTEEVLAEMGHDPEAAEESESTDVGPLLRCRRFWLEDCRPLEGTCEEYCGPQTEKFPF